MCSRTTGRYRAPAVPRRKLGPIFAVAAAALALASALVMWTRAPEATATPSTPATAAPSPAEPAAHQSPDQPATEPVLRPVAAEPATAAAPSKPPQLGRIEVIVVPFGQVFINDQHISGDRPTARLPPGTYEVRAEPPTGTVRRRVELHAGERKVVEFR